MPPETWPEVLAASVPDVAVAEGIGLGGPKLVEDSWPDLSSHGDWKTGCSLNVPLLPGPWVWCPWTQPRTFVGVSQRSGPYGLLVLECWVDSSCASPKRRTLDAYQLQTLIFGDLCALELPDLI